MSGPSPRDAPDLEPTTPALGLLQRRETRDADRFKAWCLEQNGSVRVGTYEFHPAAVLALKQDVYKQEMGLWHGVQQTEDDETVCVQFPAPIAIPYQQFLQGPREPMQRLTRMRDTWESLVRVLSAMTIAEASIIGVGPSPVRLIESNSVRKAVRKDLKTDSISARIGLLEGLLENWRECGIRSKIADLIPPDLPAELRRLNSVRNGFSHVGTLSDKQAQSLIDENTPPLHDVLVDLLFLKDTPFVRLIKVKPGLPLMAEVDSLSGCSMARTVRDFTFDSDAQAVILGAGKVGAFDRVIAMAGSRSLDLSPFFYSCDDSSGHQTRVLFFKKQRDAKCYHEIAGEAMEKPSDAGFHAPEFARCGKALFGSDGAIDDE